MNQRDLTSLLIKLMGFFILVLTLSELLADVNFVLIDHVGDTRAYTIAITVLVVALAIGLAFFRANRQIADYLFFIKEPNSESESTHPRKLEEIVIALLGVYFFADGLLRLFINAGWYVASFLEAPGNRHVWSSIVVVPAIAKILIGASIFLSSRGLTTLRYRLLDFRKSVRDLGAEK